MAETAPAGGARIAARRPARRWTEAAPVRGVPLESGHGAVRVVAPNPSPMTFHGTNSWFVETDDGLVLIDPGPDNDEHLAALLRVAAGRLRHVLISHGHADHVGLARRFARQSGIAPHAHPDLAARLSAGADAIEVRPLGEGGSVAGLRAIATPGHAADHLCFLRGDGVLFSADHVMGWSSSVVPPRAGGGSSSDYLESLRRLRTLAPRVLLCGHGPPVTAPLRLIEALIAHRGQRERQVAARLERSTATLAELQAALYPGGPEGLDAAIRANLLGHLEKLSDEGAVAERDGVWSARRPQDVPA